VVVEPLPLSAASMTAEAAKAGVAEHGWDSIYEPDEATVIDELLLRYVEALVYQAVPKTWPPSNRRAWWR